MTANRRNYYRVLHVQPEAPGEVIRASYRTLMGTLRHHPDLGGDHADAVLLNEAYQLLSDPARRAAYDQALRRQTEAGRRVAELSLRNCPLCSRELPLTIRPDTRCDTCGCPLAMLVKSAAQRRELFGRRGSVRRERDVAAVAHVGWPSASLPVRWRDLSISGLSFYAPKRIPAKQVVRLIDHSLEVVATVVGCRAKGQLYTVHGRLVTAMAL